MKIPENKTLAMAVVALGTILLQFPNLGEWYGRISKEHTHIVTIVEGIIGLVTIIWATKKETPATPSAGGQK